MADAGLGRGPAGGEDDIVAELLPLALAVAILALVVLVLVG